MSSMRAPMLRATWAQTILITFGYICIGVLLTLLVIWSANIRDDVSAMRRNVTVGNFPAPVTDVSVNNFPPPVTTVSVDNFPEPCCNVSVNNFPPPVTTVSVDNFPAQVNVNITNTESFPVHIVDALVNLTGDVIFPSSFQAQITNFPDPVTELNVSVLNPVTTVSVDNFPAPAPTIVQGVTPGGAVVNVSTTSTGSLQVNLREPTTAYGSLLTENLWPIFQTTAVYGVNPGKTSVHTFGTGSVTVSNSAFVISTGSTPGSFATLQSRKRLFYRPGQGSRAVFSALFSDTSNTLISRAAGIGSPEDGVFFGFLNGLFGIYYNNRGRREIRTLTVTTASSTAESVSVTLNGVLYMVPVTASGNIQRTVWELAQFSYAGWRVEAVGATVVFISDQAQAYLGSFSFSATTAVASFALTRAGTGPNIFFTSQSFWNGDRLDGNGTSGVVLDTSKFNVYGISMGYLGASAIRFFVQVIPPGTSDAYFATVHTLELPNSHSITTFGNPSFPFSVAARTFAAEDGLIQVGSFSGFVEGGIKYHGNRFTFQRSLSTTITSAMYYPFFTIHNAHVRNGAANQGVITVVGVSGSVNNNQPATIYFFRSTDSQMHQLGGNPNFQPYASNTGILYDTSATSFTPTGMEQLIWAQELSQVGSSQRYFLNAQNFESITLEPGEFISVCGRTNMGTAAYMSASLEVREDD